MPAALQAGEVAGSSPANPKCAREIGPRGHGEKEAVFLSLILKDILFWLVEFKGEPCPKKRRHWATETASAPCSVRPSPHLLPRRSPGQLTGEVSLQVLQKLLQRTAIASLADKMELSQKSWRWYSLRFPFNPSHPPQKKGRKKDQTPPNLNIGNLVVSLHHFAAELLIPSPPSASAIPSCASTK